PGKPNSRCKVVLVCFEATARNTIRADTDKTSRGHVVNVCTIFSVDRRRVVLVTQAAVQRQPWRDAIAVVGKEVETVCADLLWIIDARNAGHEREAEQQIGQRV